MRIIFKEQDARCTYQGDGFLLEFKTIDEIDQKSWVRSGRCKCPVTALKEIDGKFYVDYSKMTDDEARDYLLDDSRFMASKLTKADNITFGPEGDEREFKDLTDDEKGEAIHGLRQCDPLFDSWALDYLKGGEKKSRRVDVIK